MKRVFLLGDPVAHSISPPMHNAAFHALSLGWNYEPLHTPREGLQATVARLRTEECAGANVTMPHKEAVIEFLDALSVSARQVGAVNTIVKRAGRLIGANTDVYGFAQALRRARVQVRGQHAVILGAGGAARAAVCALAAAGIARVTIVNRTAARAEALAADLRRRFPRLGLDVNGTDALTRADTFAPLSASLIVNATGVGMSPRTHESPLPRGAIFPRGAVAFDLVYRPLRTRFLREAERAGALGVEGIDMLVFQGAAAFRLWTGRDAPVDVMFAAARNALGGV